MSDVIALNDSWVLFSDRVPNIRIATVDHPLEVWSQVHRWIEKAYDNDWSICNAVDVFNEIIKRHATLWLVHDGQQLVGTFVTKIESGSRGRALNVVALGGEGMADWISAFDHSVTTYAREHRCHLIAEMGRPGWIRVLGNLGWVVGPPTMMKVP